MIGSAVGALVEDAMPWEDRGVAQLMFKADPIRAEVASTSCCYDLEVFCDLLDDNMVFSKFSDDVGSTVEVPGDPDCVIFECTEAGGGFSDKFVAYAGATHAEKPKDVTAEIL